MLTEGSSVIVAFANGALLNRCSSLGIKGLYYCFLAQGSLMVWSYGSAIGFYNRGSFRGFVLLYASRTFGLSGWIEVYGWGSTLNPKP